MKNHVKAIVATLFLMTMVAFIPSVSKAALSAPTGLKQVEATTSSVTVAWDAVIGAEKYYADYGDGITWTQPERVYNSENQYYKSKLSPGKSYFVRIYAVDSNNVMTAPTQPLEVVTAPDCAEMGVPVITQVLDTSMSFQWAPVSGATSYEITSRYANISPNVSLPATTTSVTMTNLAPLTYYGFNVVACRTSPSGYKAFYSDKSVTYTKTTATVVAPNTPSTSNISIASASSSSNTVSFQAADPAGKANGYELELRKVKGGKLVQKITSTSTVSATVKVSKNTPYKYRVRLFAESGATRLYSGWSGYRYFFLQNVTGKRHYKSNSKNATFKMKWGKVTGATGYTVYMSTKRDGKYKKVKSLGKNAKKVTLSKYGKKRISRYGNYYVRVVPKVKDGKKTIKNDTQLTNYSL